MIDHVIEACVPGLPHDDSGRVVTPAPAPLPDILFVTDLAKLLRMSVRTVYEIRARHGNLPPELPRLDKRPRWARQAVEAWLQQTQASHAFRRAQGRR